MKPVSWIRSPNFTKGRGGVRPDIIVIHVTEGSAASATSWLTQRVSKVSAHYLITLDRRVIQFVDEHDTAWANGRILRPTARIVKERGHASPNRYSISIEHEGTATSVWPDTMYADSAALVREIAARWRIPLDRDHVIGHREIYAAKTCPGAGDVDRIVRMAAGEVAAPVVLLRRGSKGPLVEALQLALVRKGTLTPAQVATGPGIFGPQTEAAVREFQRRAGLAVDGIVGGATFEALGIT